jgi:hypothetical protein
MKSKSLKILVTVIVLTLSFSMISVSNIATANQLSSISNKNKTIIFNPSCEDDFNKDLEFKKGVQYIGGPVTVSDPNGDVIDMVESTDTETIYTDEKPNIDIKKIYYTKEGKSVTLTMEMHEDGVIENRGDIDNPEALDMVSYLCSITMKNPYNDYDIIYTNKSVTLNEEKEGISYSVDGNKITFNFEVESASKVYSGIYAATVDSTLVSSTKFYMFADEVTEDEFVENADYISKEKDITFQLELKSNIDYRMPYLLISDKIPTCCLEYLETTSIKLNGEELAVYPEITIMEEPEEFFTCSEEKITIEEGDLLYNFLEIDNFELNKGDKLTITYKMNVTYYSGCQIENCAEAHIWSCAEQKYYYEGAKVKINCIPQENTFKKYVKDPTTGVWEDEEIEIFVGEIANFKLEYSYFGNGCTADICFKDELPCNLDFSLNADPIQSNHSSDLKLVYWNLTDVKLKDGDVITIEFDANVVCVSGDCIECFNKAIMTIKSGCNPAFEYVDTVLVKSKQNHPPNTPIITGPEKGVINEEITFTATVSDPNEHSVYLLVEFGDGSDSGWLGPYTSGSEIEIKHTYDSLKTYKIKAKAKDNLGEESGYGNTISVDIESPSLKNIYITPSLIGFGRVKLILTNNGEVDLENVDWEMSITGGILKRINVTNNGTIANLAVGKSANVLSGGMIGKGSISGVGRINCEIKIDSDDYSDKKAIKGLVLGKLIILFPLVEHFEE